MGALAHLFEAEGLPTTQISLIREHTEHIRPPRALWVPFILGRPLGRPDDPAFQTRVLTSALTLFERPTGPVLVDHDEEAGGEVEVDGASCPVSWAPVAHDGALGERMREEIAHLAVWYDLNLERTGRTAFGTAGLTIDETLSVIAELADGGDPDRPAAVSLGEFARLVAEDLKAWVTEAAAGQPGIMTPYALKAWFWEQTVAGEAIVAAHRAARRHPDASYRALAEVMVPKELR